MIDEIADEIHKQSRKPKEYRKVVVNAVNDIWSMDLVDMSMFEEHNENFNYILTCIDLFSRKAWAEKLKTKTGLEVVGAIKNIIKNAGAKPNKIWVDQGTEFYNKDVEKLGIELYSTYGKSKAAVVERFNRTLKNMMFKKFTKQGNRKWVGILDKLLDTYNNNKHRGLDGETPNNIYKLEPVKIISEIKKKRKPKLKEGDRVRISYSKGVFDKGYYPNWGYELFTVDEVLKTQPTMYKIKDYKNEVIKGSFYESELLKTKQKEGDYLVESILKERKVKGKKQVLVKWLGYPESEATWEPYENLKEIYEK
jgi:hypothetical protein